MQTFNIPLLVVDVRHLVETTDITTTAKPSLVILSQNQLQIDYSFRNRFLLSKHHAKFEVTYGRVLCTTGAALVF